MKINLLRFILFVGLFLCFSINAQNCSFTKKLNYKDGSTGCLDKLPFANETPKGNDRKLTELVADDVFINIIIVK